MRGKHFRQFLRCHFIPLHGTPIRCEQRRFPVVPVNFAKRSLAIRARLAPVPLLHHVSYQAFRGIPLNFRQAFLAAVFPLGPLGTLFQVKLRFAEHRIARRSRRIHSHRCRAFCLRTSHYPRAAIHQVSANRRNGGKNKRAYD
jgi:hypothetical protein